MPLVQSRMIALLDACKAYSAWIKHRRLYAQTLDRQAQEGKMPAASALSLLITSLLDSPLSEDQLSSVLKEDAHFAAFAKRNESMRRYRQRRRAREIPPRSGGPTSIPRRRESAELETVATNPRRDETRDFVAELEIVPTNPSANAPTLELPPELPREHSYVTQYGTVTPAAGVNAEFKGDLFSNE